MEKIFWWSLRIWNYDCILRVSNNFISIEYCHFGESLEGIIFPGSNLSLFQGDSVLFFLNAHKYTEATDYTIFTNEEDADEDVYVGKYVDRIIFGLGIAFVVVAAFGLLCVCCVNKYYLIMVCLRETGFRMTKRPVAWLNVASSVQPDSFQL